VGTIVELRKEPVESNTPRALRVIGVLQCILKTNAKLKGGDKMENNKLMDESGVIDWVEELQNDKDRRIRDAAVRLVQGNMILDE
jgi:hypothetical protein